MGKRYFSLLASGLAITCLLAACDSEEKFDRGITAIPGATTSLAAIATLGDGAQSAASLEQAMRIGINSGAALRELLAPAQHVLGLTTPDATPRMGSGANVLPQGNAALLAPSRLLQAELQRATAFRAVTDQRYACAGGGSMVYSGTIDAAAGTFNLTMTASSCREGNAMANGPLRINGSFDPAARTFHATATFGSGNRLISDSGDYQLFNFDGSNLYSIDTLDLYMVVDTSSTTTSQGESFLSATRTSGKVRSSDFLTSFEVSYNNLLHNSSIVVAAAETTATETLNGSLRESWREDSAAYYATLQYTDFILTWAQTADHFDLAANGAVETVAPDSYCFNGAFTVATVTPIRHDFATEMTVAGDLLINDNNHLEFLNDGTLKVTIGDGSTQNYATLDDLDDTCELRTLGSDSNLIVVDWANGPITTTGSTMLATLVWTGGETSDMDTHLSHYVATTPTAADEVDWHIFYGNKTDGGIGALDIDDVQGYGPEHITLPTLPVGYYMLYIHNYSLDQDPSAQVMVSLRVGDNAYAFPSFTFTPATASIYRVVDVRVEADGTVTLLPPDESIRSYAPRLRAAKL